MVLRGVFLFVGERVPRREEGSIVRAIASGALACDEVECRTAKSSSSRSRQATVIAAHAGKTVTVSMPPAWYGSSAQRGSSLATSFLTSAKWSRSFARAAQWRSRSHERLGAELRLANVREQARIAYSRPATHREHERLGI